MTEGGEPFASTRQIYLLGRALREACGIGNPPPWTVEMLDRMRNPRVGDLVIEVTSLRGYDPDGVGWLRSIERNPDHPAIIDRYVIEPLDKPGVEQGWENAEFFAVPTDRTSQWVEPAPAPAAVEPCKWKTAGHGPCSDEVPEWDIVYPPINGEPDVEGPFCFQHAVMFIDRAERANAIRVPNMVQREGKS